MPPTSHVLDGYAKSLLVFEGGEDVGPFGRSGDFYSAAGPPKSLVNIPGANHVGYYDDVCIVDDNTATISQADQQRIAKWSGGENGQVAQRIRAAGRCYHQAIITAA